MGALFSDDCHSLAPPASVSRPLSFPTSKRSSSLSIQSDSDQITPLSESLQWFPVAHKVQTPHQEYLAPPHAFTLLYSFLPLFSTDQFLYVVLFIPQIHVSFSFQVTCTSCSLSLEGGTYLCRAVSFSFKFQFKIPPLHRISSCAHQSL